MDVQFLSVPHACGLFSVYALRSIILGKNLLLIGNIINVFYYVFLLKIITFKLEFNWECFLSSFNFQLNRKT
jgi:hypothetical protein